MPSKKSLDDIKSKLLKPALTSHFEVQIPIPPGLSGTSGDQYLSANGLQQFANLNQATLNLLCSETSLPGSNIGLMDITSDYHGVTVRHANRRIYDDRIDMTFYVDADNYLPIRYFEVWIKYIVGESITSEGSRPGSRSSNYFYRLNYPDLYIAKGAEDAGLKITKYERDYKKTLTYEFVNAFPISVASMPVSYETSSLLKCTVSFSYLRYILVPPGGTEPAHPDSKGSSATTGDPSSPVNQAAFNNPQFIASNNTLPGLEGAGVLTTGGVPLSVANASGNTVGSITQQDIDSALAAERSLTL